MTTNRLKGINPNCLECHTRPFKIRHLHTLPGLLLITHSTPPPQGLAKCFTLSRQSVLVKLIIELFKDIDIQKKLRDLFTIYTSWYGYQMLFYCFLNPSTNKRGMHLYCSLQNTFISSHFKGEGVWSWVKFCPPFNKIDDKEWIK